MSKPFSFGSFEEPPPPRAGTGSDFEAPSVGGFTHPGYAESAGSDSVPGFASADDLRGEGAVKVGKPPVRWLYLGITAAAVGMVPAGVSSAIGIAVSAWVLAGPVAIGLLAVFIVQDNQNRSAPIYAAPASVAWLYRGLLLVAGIGVILGAVRIALWAGRL